MTRNRAFDLMRKPKEPEIDGGSLGCSVFLGKHGNVVIFFCFYSPVPSSTKNAQFYIFYLILWESGRSSVPVTINRTFDVPSMTKEPDMVGGLLDCSDFIGKH